MNFKRAVTVYRKEMLEMFRDKRTIFSTIILPFILYPLIFVGVSSLMMRQTAKLEEQGAVIALADSLKHQNSNRKYEVDSLIVGELHKIEHFRFVPYSRSTDSLYAEDTVHGIITFRDSMQTSRIPVYQVTLQYDQSTDRGKLIGSKVSKALQSAGKEIMRLRINQRGLSTEIANTVNLNQNDTSSPEKKLGSLLGSILPYLLIMLLIAGASVVAGDLVAGEKERKTLETLLVSSAHRNEIVLGKYMTIISFAMINVVVNLVSLYFSMRSIAGQSGLEMAGVKFPLSGFLVMLLALIPLATLYAALLLSISSFSRNMKEARSYEQPVLFISMFLAMSSLFPAIELNNGLALVPVINIALLFKAVMMSDYQVSHLLLTILSTVVLNIGAIILTVRLFNNESVLFRSDADTSLKQVKKNKQAFFNPFYGLIFFAAALLALYYLGGSWQSKDIVSGLLKTQLFIVLLPVLLLLKIFRINVKSTLRLNRTTLTNLLLVPFIAVPAAVIVTLLAQAINLIYPIPEAYLEQMSKLLKMPELSLWQVIAVLAVMPGICEELMFRGFIFRFFEKGSKWFPIFISAVLFAVFHLDPYRFIPVLLLGILLAWLLHKSGSIYVSMLAHALNNSLAAVFLHFGDASRLKTFISDGENLNWWLGIPAAIILAIALYTFNRANREQQNQINEFRS